MLRAQVPTKFKILDNENTIKVQRFHGKASDGYNLWCCRINSALDGKVWLTKLANEENGKPDLEARRKSSAIIVAALGDSPLRVCISKRNDPMAMLELLDKRYASSRASSRISTLTSVFSKKYTDSQSMGKYINEFEDLFAKLEMMGAGSVIQESLKAPCFSQVSVQRRN